MLNFYYAPTSCALGCHIALEEAGAEFTAHRLNLLDAETVAAYRQINPKGTVPALRIDDHLITESAAILWYIAQTFPAARLWPDTLLEQTEALSIMSWLASTVHIARRQSRAPQRFTSDPAAFEALQARGREAFIAHLQRLDQLYDGRTWLIGERISVVDCYVVAFMQWARLDKIDMAAFAALQTFTARMLQRPATRRALERERSVLVKG